MDQEPPPKHIIIIYNNDDASDSIKESGCPISPQETVELDYRGKKARAEVIDVALLIKKTINQIDKRIKVSLYSVESIFTLKKIIIKHKNQKNILFFNLCESLESNPYMEVEAARLLEDSKIPFTGNGSQPLQYCLDKHLCYQMLSSAKVSVPKTFLIKNVNQIEQLKFIFDENKKYIIKPNTEDGSIGISFSSVVSTYDELIVQATDMLNNMGYDLVVQEFIDGREINLSVLDIKHQLFGYSEVNFDRLDPNLPRILNYSSKWDEESAEYAATKSLAAELESDLKEALLKNARMAHQALNLNAYVRFDFRCTSNNQVYIIDVNPNCDLSETSGFIKSFNFKGLSFIKIIRTIIYSAMNESSLHNNQSVAFDRTASFSTKEYII